MEENKEINTLEPQNKKAHLALGRMGWAVVFILVFGLLALVYLGMKNSKEGPIRVGDKVPDFTFTTFDGEETQLNDLQGQVVVINFWASWCKPCEQEAADLQTAWQIYEQRGDITFLGVDYVDTEPEAMGYLNKFDITYPNGPDLRTSISQAFRIRGVPETYIIDKQGHLAYIKVGPFISLAEINAAIEPLLTDSGN